MILKDSFQDHKKEWILCLTTLISALLYFLFIFDPAIFQYGDNSGYMNLAIQFAKHLNFNDPTVPMETSLLWWPPGFPVFLSIFYKLSPYNWILPKVFIIILFFFSVYLFISSIYKNSVKVEEPMLLIIAISFSSTIHMISSYLYSELFFTALLLIFISIIKNIKKIDSITTILLMSLFSVYLFSVRLIGMSIPIAYSIYLLIKLQNLKKAYSIIPILFLISAILIFLFHPNLTVQSLRSSFGLSLSETEYYSGNQMYANGVIGNLLRFISKLIPSLRGYIFTLFPQSVFRYSYSLVEMNLVKMAITGCITFLIITGIIHIYKRDLFISLVATIFTAFLLLYGPLYVRLLVPLTPLLILFYNKGVIYFTKKFVINSKYAHLIIIIAATFVISDNLILSFTNPHKNMPYSFGNSSYQQCIQWVTENSKASETVVSQVNQYLHIKRKSTGFSIPYRKTDNKNIFLEYLYKNRVDYLIISSFYQRPNSTYMDVVRETIESYPHLFHKIYNADDSQSYVIKFDRNMLKETSNNLGI